MAQRSKTLVDFAEDLILVPRIHVTLILYTENKSKLKHTKIRAL